MIGTPVNLNSIHIPLIPNGCMKAEFDSTYPIHLNGIISQEEFQQSIGNINRRISSYKNIVIILLIIFILGTIGGTICCVVAGLSATSFDRNRFYILLVVGIIISMIGSLSFSIGMCLIHSKRTTKLRQAIAEESMKYSTRSPISCSWRLNIIGAWNRGFGYHRNGQSTYDLIIDIGRFIAPGDRNAVYYSNQIVSEPAVLFGQQSNLYEPPPYPGQMGPRFCSRCGALRQDFTNKVCLSCEQSFHDY